VERKNQGNELFLYCMLTFFVAVILSYCFAFYFYIGRKNLSLELLYKVRSGKFRSSLPLLLIYWSTPIFLIGIWGCITSLITFRNIPQPQEVLSSFLQLLWSGDLLVQSYISFQRVFIGFSLASIVGVFVGILAGSFLVFNYIVVPVNSFFRYIPPTAFISFLIIYFGIGESYKLAVIFLGVIFFIIQMVVDIVEDIDTSYIEMAIVSDFSNMKIVFSVIIPFCFPKILDILRVNLSAAWTFLVAAEIVGSDNGLGHLIAISQRYLRLGDLYASVMAFGTIGLISDQCLNLLSRNLFKWYYINSKK
jgi:NitT/TauT family transport system permease protein